MLLVSYLYSALTTTDVEVDEVVNTFLPPLEEGEDTSGIVNALAAAGFEWQHGEVTLLGSNPIALEACQTLLATAILDNDRSMRKESMSFLAHVGRGCNHATSTQRARGRTCQ